MKGRIRHLDTRAWAGMAAVVFALALPASVQAQEAAGQVQIVVGAAQLIDLSGKARPIERGAEIRQGDRIITEDGALVQMKMTDGALVSVRTNTDVTVEKYRHDEKSAQNSNMLLKLARGALRSITGLIGGSNPDAYKIVTPTATIGIRGTDHEPVFIPEPKPGETPLAPPGTYDKVNSGATRIITSLGNVDIKPGQVGFVPVAPGVVPKLLPAVPDFFKQLDPKGGAAATTPENPKEAGNAKLLNRPSIRPALGTDVKSLGTLDSIKTEKTLSPAVLEAAPTLQQTIKPEATTTIQPTTTLTAPTTIQPTTTLTAPTTIQPTTTLTAPTTLKSTTTINPLLVPKTTTTILK